MKKTLAAVVVPFMLLTVTLFTVSVVFEYKPGAVEKLNRNGVPDRHEVDEGLTFLIWNIGYGGLGKDADFFMDGGSSSKPQSKEIVKSNLRGISDLLNNLESDILMLQEVDVDSHRSFKIDQLRMLKAVKPDLEFVFAPNFRVWMIPVPMSDPIGKVYSGLVTASKIRSVSAERHSLKSVDLWPEKLFHLKRCMLVSRYKKTDGKELVVINIHLSAYDDGKIRNEQMKKLREFAVSEYEKGNSVIIGGDWNQRMPGISKNQFGKYTTDEKYLVWARKIDNNLKPEGWKWVYDIEAPTVRNNESAYRKGVNFTTVIDGFFVSPDVEVVEVKTVDTGFEFSDHNPVVMKVKFGGGE